MTGTDNNIWGKISRTAIEYMGLKVDCCKLKCIENLSIISNKLLVVLIATMFGAVVLQLLGFALAFLLAELTGSIALGFAIISATFAMFLAIVYAKRDTLFIKGLARMYKRMFFKNQ